LRSSGGGSASWPEAGCDFVSPSVSRPFDHELESVLSVALTFWFRATFRPPASTSISAIASPNSLASRRPSFVAVSRTWRALTGAKV